MTESHQTILETAISKWKNETNPSQTDLDSLSELGIDSPVIQSKVLPYFVSQLFGDYYKTFQSEVDIAIVSEFIIQFMYRYLNMELCDKRYAVFKTKLYYGLNKYKSYMLQASDEYTHLMNANVNITSTSKTVSSDKSNTNVKFDGSETGSNTGTVKDEASGGTSGTSTSNGTGSATTTQEVNQTTADNSSGITANSDYPQSMVDLTIQPPNQLTWNYASDANQNVSKNSGTNDTSLDSTNSSSSENTGSFSNETTSSNTRTDNLTHNITRDDTTNTDTTSNGTVDITKDQDVMSQFDRIMTLIDYLESHRYSAIYYVIEKLGIYFMSQFVCEDREGYIDTSTNLLSELQGG